MNNTKKLYRSCSNRIIAGVCGGLGDYLGIDANIIRLIMAVFTITGGAGILIYLAAMILLPEEQTAE